jgi:hypothetical protein
MTGRPGRNGPIPAGHAWRATVKRIPGSADSRYGLVADVIPRVGLGVGVSNCARAGATRHAAGWLWHATSG